MANYYVSKKRSAHGVIESLLVHPVHSNNTLQAGSVWTRHQVVTALAAGHTFSTVTASANNTWNIGARVEVFPVMVDYLKTVQDNRPGDNLDNLPPL